MIPRSIGQAAFLYPNYHARLYEHFLLKCLMPGPFLTLLFACQSQPAASEPHWFCHWSSSHVCYGVVILQAYSTKFKFCNPILDMYIWKWIARCFVTINFWQVASYFPPRFPLSERVLYSTFDENLAKSSPAKWQNHESVSLNWIYSTKLWLYTRCIRKVCCFYGLINGQGWLCNERPSKK